MYIRSKTSFCVVSCFVAVLHVCCLYQRPYNHALSLSPSFYVFTESSDEIILRTDVWKRVLFHYQQHQIIAWSNQNNQHLKWSFIKYSSASLFHSGKCDCCELLTVCVLIGWNMRGLYFQITLVRLRSCMRKAMNVHWPSKMVLKPEYPVRATM